MSASDSFLCLVNASVGKTDGRSSGCLVHKRKLALVARHSNVETGHTQERNRAHYLPAQPRHWKVELQSSDRVVWNGDCVVGNRKCVVRNGDCVFPLSNRVQRSSYCVHPFRACVSPSGNNVRPFCNSGYPLSDCVHPFGDCVHPFGNCDTHACVVAHAAPRVNPLTAKRRSNERENQGKCASRERFHAEGRVNYDSGCADFLPSTARFSTHNTQPHTTYA